MYFSAFSAIRHVERPFGFTLIRLAFGQPPSPVRGKARTLAVAQMRSSIGSRTDKPSPLTGEGGAAAGGDG